MRGAMLFVRSQARLTVLFVFPLLLISFISGVAFASSNETVGINPLLQTILILAGIALAHSMHRDSSRQTIEYLAALPVTRRKAVLLPLHTGSVIVLGLGLLVFIHEVSGAGYAEHWLLRYLIDQSHEKLSFASLPLGPWLGLFPAPLLMFCLPPITAFWLHAVAIRAWHKHIADRGMFGMIGGFVCTVVVFLSVTEACGVRDFFTRWRIGAPSSAEFALRAIVMLGLTAGAYLCARKDANGLPTESFPLREAPWMS